MSKKRIIDTKFWDDSYIIKLNPYEKLLFLYFISCPLANLCGIYEIDLKRISFDIGLDINTILGVLKRFQNDGKIFYIDGWIFVRNTKKHQNSSPMVKIGIERELNSVPEKIKAKISQIHIQYPYSIDTVSGSTDTTPHLDLDLNLDLNLTAVTSLQDGAAVQTTVVEATDSPMGKTPPPPAKISNQEFGHPEVNDMIKFLQEKIGVKKFETSETKTRRYGKLLVDLKEKLGDTEFNRRLKKMLNDEQLKQRMFRLEGIYYGVKEIPGPTDTEILNEISQRLFTHIATHLSDMEQIRLNAREKWLLNYALLEEGEITPEEAVSAKARLVDFAKSEFNLEIG